MATANRLQSRLGLSDVHLAAAARNWVEGDLGRLRQWVDHLEQTLTLVEELRDIDDPDDPTPF